MPSPQFRRFQMMNTAQYRFANAEAATLVAAMTVKPTNARKGLIDNLIGALKAASLWTPADVLYVFAAHTSQAALLNWKNPGTTDATLIGAPPFTADRCFTTDAVSTGIETNYNASTFAGAFTQNSACLALWSLVSAQDAVGYVAGWNDGTDGARILPRYTDDKCYYTINSASEGNSNAIITDGSGFWSINRSGSNLTQLYKTGAAVTVAVGGTVNSTALNNHTFSIGQTATANFCVTQVPALLFAGSIASGAQLSLYTAMRAYMTGVGVP